MAFFSISGQISNCFRTQYKRNNIRIRHCQRKTRIYIYSKPYKLIGSVVIISGRVMVYVLVAGFRSTDLVDIYTTVGRELRMVELENKGARA